MRHRLVPSLFLGSFGCGIGLDALKDYDDTGALDDGPADFTDGYSGGTGTAGGDGSTGGAGSTGGGSSSGSGSSSGGSTGGDPSTDADNDGFTADVDCDDTDRDTHPGAAPADSTSACMTDADGDRYGDQYVSSNITPGTDCNDSDAATNPADSDSDGWSTCDGDCDDNDSGRSPGTAEVAFDGIDQDCSGADAGTVVTASGTGADIYDYETSWGYATVTGCGTVQDIEITVRITHTYVADLGIAIHEPATATYAMLQSFSFTNDTGSGISGTWSSKGTGTLSSVDPLSTVTGRAGSGQWALEIYDQAFFDEGALDSWSLTLYCI